MNNEFSRRLRRLSDKKLSYHDRLLAEQYDYNYRLGVENNKDIKDMQYGSLNTQTLQGVQPRGLQSIKDKEKLKALDPLSDREIYLSNMMKHHQSLTKLNPQHKIPTLEQFGRL